MDFGSLWIGSSLSKVEQTALASYIHHGHSLTLFVYDMNLEVPKGVIKKDASTLISESEIFKVDNSFSAFSDIFRFNMMKHFNLTWTDTDSICLSSDWNFEDYIFAYEDDLNKVGSSILRMPNTSDLVAYLAKAASSFDKSRIVWSEIGPDLVTKGIEKFNLKQYIQPRKTFFPIHYLDWHSIWDPTKLDWVLEECKDSHAFQIWNQFLNRDGINKNDLPQGSTIEHFYNKFISQYF